MADVDRVTSANGERPRKRLLVVDDEINVLAGLADRMRCHRDIWDVRLADSGASALVQMDEQPADVVISDLRMPGMSGDVLLGRIKDQYPLAVRLLLSGRADADAPRLSLGVAHQLLAKPCDAGSLAGVIERAELQRTLIDDATVHRLAERLDQLPAPPSVYWDLSRSHGETDPMAAMVALIARDADVAAKLVDLANWPYSGLAQRSTSLLEAAEVVGSDTVRTFAVAANALAHWPRRNLPDDFSYSRLRAHTFATARVARRIAERPEVARAAFTTALLHDIGHLVIAIAFADRYPAIIARTARGTLLADAQRAELGVDHAELGAYLLGMWSLPTEVVRAVADHVHPARSDSDGFDTTTVLHVASALVHEHLPPMRGVPRPPLLDGTLLDSIGVADRMQQWHWVASEEVAAVTRSATR